MCMGFMPLVRNNMVNIMQNQFLRAPMVQTVHRVLTWPSQTLRHELGKIRHSITHLLSIISEAFNIRHVSWLTSVLVLYGAAVDRAESHTGSPRRVCVCVWYQVQGSHYSCALPSLHKLFLLSDSCSFCGPELNLPFPLRAVVYSWVHLCGCQEEEKRAQLSRLSAPVQCCSSA